MQSVRSRIWTRVAVSISCVDNHYTTGVYPFDEIPNVVHGFVKFSRSSAMLIISIAHFHSLSVLFFRTYSDLCIFHLSARSNFNRLHNSERTNILTQLCIILYLFTAIIPCEFFAPTLAVSISLEWQQVALGFQNSSQYSRWS